MVIIDKLHCIGYNDFFCWLSDFVLIVSEFLVNFVFPL